MLDVDIKQQLSEYLQLMEGEVVLTVSAGEDEASQALIDLIDEIAAMSDRIQVKRETLLRTPSFAVDRPNAKTGIVFAGIPLGHEFNSLVLALLQVSGRAPKVSEATIERIQGITVEAHFETYISLSCHNCPDVVQALNLISLLNPGISHTMIDGGVFQQEVDTKDIMGVPAIFRDGEFFGGGRLSLEAILDMLGQAVDPSVYNEKSPFDVLVIGGGPAGVSAAIYAARKGIRTGIVAERIGGQVLDTMAVENFISVPYTEGPKIGLNLEAHMKQYAIDIMTQQLVKSIARREMVEITLENGAVLKSRAVIIATGAKWRNVGAPGEAEFKNKGVAYCPHCDGPLYKGKAVAVIGGGNSGIEAAIDLAGITKHVTVLEFMPELKADAVLQQKLYSLPNVTVHRNVQTKAIVGTDKVEGIDFEERTTGEMLHAAIEGVFVQIGLLPNTAWLGDTLERNRMGEIVVDSRGATAMAGVFAAGDCTTTAYKQIIIAMGSGATAALSAFDYLIRNEA